MIIPYCLKIPIRK